MTAAPTDPVVDLIAQRDLLFQKAAAADPGDKVRLTWSAVGLERAIVDMTATSIPGIVAQLRLLREFVETEWADDREERLIRSIIAGGEGLQKKEETGT